MRRNTMRGDSPFPHRSPQAQPEPQAPPSRAEVLRQRLSRFRARFGNALLVGAGILIALAAMLLYDTAKPDPQRLTLRDIDAAVEKALEAAPPKPSYSSQVYEVIRPSLVRVRALGPRGEGGLGTGVVIDDRGTILTSLHVVRGASRVQVVFADGTESDAEIEVSQPENDLAVLRPAVIPDDLVPATLAPSTVLRVGDEVVAVGNPFGISNSLSAGVVSGLGRTIRPSKSTQTLNNLIQFDAAVNPGNSGGPLVNRAGEVVGLVTALLNPTDQEFFIGIGFAVPIETAAAAAGSPPY
ncbi:MAG: trypsin-like peptidase domain-containing protein [Dehalococcoidia bacterium]|nr:trypsin-like peptidase domain-containing protein [Dehalococcoidia bacterium]